MTMSASTASAINEVRLEDYRPTDYAVSRVDLDIALHPSETRVVAQLHLSRRPGVPASTALTLAGDELDLLAVEIDGVVLRPDLYRASSNELTIFAPPAGPFTLELTTRIDPQANTKLMGIYRS